MKNQSRQENLLYLVVWGLLFAAPLLSLYIRTVSDPHISFNWSEVFTVWKGFAVFLLLFLIHNFLLAPLLIHQHRRMLYLSVVAVVLAVFTVYQCNDRPEPKEWHHHHTPPPMEEADHHPSRPDGPPPRQFRPEKPPHIIGEHDILAVVVLILMFGANLGTKLYYRTREDRKKLLELEKQNLEQQLEYLKYQINPHFFMNTLNNIHALVDIDPEKAQQTIVELSKMMRFVLYEGDKRGVSLSREFEFIRTYINLMQLRYTDKVKITVELPHEPPDKTIPPLMLISFIENAFKHGISYQHPSFIDISAGVENDKLHFLCRNSKAEQKPMEQGGVGLTNVRKRLKLLYDQSYSLRIQDDTDIYTVELTIPLL